MIHITQNLSSSRDKYKPTDIFPPRDTRYLNYSASNKLKQSMPPEDRFDKSISFKGKKEIIKQVIKSANKTFIDKVADSKVIKKTLGSDFFNGILDKTSKEEVLVNSVTALGICCALRPATLLAFPGDKDKDNCKFAAAHSISSGVWGLIVPLLLVKPFTSGIGHSMKNMEKHFSDKTLKQMYPHLNMDSIKQGVDELGKIIRKPKDEWLDITGRRFSTDLQDFKNIFLPKHISEVSPETLQTQIPNIDIKSTLNKSGEKISANNWLDDTGSKIKPAFNNIFICVKDSEKAGHKYYPLQHVNSELLQEVYPDLDIKSINGDTGKRLYPDKWLKKDGKPYDFDMDSIFLSSVRDTSKTIPYTTGHYQKNDKGALTEVLYQKNANNKNDTGTPITSEMVESSKINTIKLKLLGWIPEIVTAYPKAVATISILPFILKEIFGLEKKKEAKMPQTQTSFKNNSPHFKQFIKIATNTKEGK